MDVGAWLQRAADGCGWRRERYDPGRVPTDPRAVAAVICQDDLRTAVALGSLVMGARPRTGYTVVCGWPGWGWLYPYADEYWGAAGSYPEADPEPGRRLGQMFLEEVTWSADLGRYYRDGLTAAYWREFGQAQRWLPAVPSLAAAGRDFGHRLQAAPGYKVFVWPSLYGRHWERGRCRYRRGTPKDFWLGLLDALTARQWTPVVAKSWLTHDLSADRPQALHYAEAGLDVTAAVMRSCHCVLDVFSGVSRLALLARSPFVALDERARYAGQREHELDDVLGVGVPRRYIFGFPTLMEEGQRGPGAYEGLCRKLYDFLPELDREAWPTAGEVRDTVPAARLRRRTARRFGVRFLKIPKA